MASPFGKGYNLSWAATDIAFSALESFWLSIKPNGSPSKLSCEQINTLCNLLERFDACQERIRIHRNKPLPDTAARYPKTKSRKEQRHAQKRAEQMAKGLALPTPVRVGPAKADATLGVADTSTPLQPTTTKDAGTLPDADLFSSDPSPPGGGV